MEKEYKFDISFIDENNQDDYLEYIEKIVSETEYNYLVKPILLHTDTKDYVITKDPEQNIVILCYKDNGNVCISAVHYMDNEKVHTVSVNGYNYTVYYNNDLKILSRCDTLGIKEEFFTGGTPDWTSTYYYNYIQNITASKILLQQRYNVGVGNKDVYLNYISYKTPELISFERKGFHIKPNKAYASFDNNWLRVVKMPNGIGFIPTNSKVLDFNEIKDMIKELDYTMDIPKDIISAYKGKNDDIKTNWEHFI